MKQIAWAILTCMVSVVAVAQSPATPDADPWASVRFMIGKWQGTASGQPGEGTVVRQYEFVLRDRFIHETNTSTYPPQKDKKGEVHEHRSYISFDKGRKLLVLRQFHVESFVNQFALNKELSGPGKLVFDSENFENFSNRWRARETYEILRPDEFTETFELAGPDKPFQVYSRNHFKRASR